MSKLQSPPKEEGETAPQPVSTEMHPRSSEDARTPVVRPGGTRLAGPPGLLANRRDSRRAFSLIEFIGVLAVLSILAAVLIPVVIKRVDRAAWTAEVNNLAAIGNALTLQILRSNSIPSEAAWAQAAANWMRLPMNNITTNSRGYSRAFLIDTSGWLDANLPSNGYYVQTHNGTPTAPTNARVMIVSTIARWQLPLSTGRPSTTDFNDLWATSQGAKPTSTTWSGWPGTGDDLLIQRLNLEPLFHKLILNNTDPWAAYFATDTNSMASVAPAAYAMMYYLDGTVLRFYYTNAAALTLQGAQILRSDLSFSFQYGRWLQGLGPTRPAADPIAGYVDGYLGSTLNYTPKQSADLSSAILQMYNFMYDYWLFNQVPSFTFTKWQALNGAQVLLNQDTFNLIP